MVFTAEVTCRNALNDRTNTPGMCLQQVRLWDGIPARYVTAVSAWFNTNDRHPGDRHPPRGADVYWTGGSHGAGHIAKSLGSGMIRSTDAGGSGRVATVPLGWIEQHWGLRYAGWSWDTNEVTIPHPKASAGTRPPAKKSAPKARPHIQDAIDALDKAIAANKGDKSMVDKLRKQKAALEKLVKN